MSNVTVALVGLLNVVTTLLIPLIVPPVKATFRWFGNPTPGSNNPVPVKLILALVCP